ncbi:MAG: glycosyltransferase family 9 protein [Candidatus Omnitrophota bacterium]
MAWQCINKRLYLFQNRLPALLCAIIDCLGRWSVGIFIPRKKKVDHVNVRKILISRPDHLGDVVMTTAVLSLIKQSFPQAAIHMLVGSWSKDLLDSIGGIDKVIYYDNFYLNRNAIPGWKKFFLSLSQIPSVVRILLQEKYDLGIEFRPFFGNTILLMWLGRVRYRLGYGTAGMGFLLHKEGCFLPGRHFIENMLHLLSQIGVSSEYCIPSTHLVCPREDVRNKMVSLISTDQNPGKGRLKILIHPGAGKAESLWDNKKWARLADVLMNKYKATIIISGGPDERACAEKIAQDMKNKSINLAGRLSIGEFICLTTLVDFVIALDSFGAHVSAANGTATVVIHAGIQDYEIFKPYGPKVLPVTHAVDCSPCWYGCPQMHCIRDIDVDDVAKKIEEGISGRF